MGGDLGESPRRRAVWGSITRDQIIDTAVDLIREEGYDNLSIRNLADRMDIAPMAFYRHVKDRDDLLSAVVDRLIEDHPHPKEADQTWQEWLISAYMGWHELLVNEPAALQTALAGPMGRTPATEKMAEYVLAVMHQAGATDDQAIGVLAVLNISTIGYGALQNARKDWHPGPETSEVARRLSPFVSTAQYREWISSLIASWST